jgi:hypothetical protein
VTACGTGWVPASERGNARAAHFRSLLRMQRAEHVALAPGRLVAQAHELDLQGAGADARFAMDEALDVALRDPADDAAWVTGYVVDWGSA